MEEIEILIGTTYSTTSYIPLPDDVPLISYVPTTQLLIGMDIIEEVDVKNYTTTGVMIDKLAVKYNRLRLRYAAVGALVRT